jgi:hypothetical protein
MIVFYLYNRIKPAVSSLILVYTTNHTKLYSISLSTCFQCMMGNGIFSFEFYWIIIYICRKHKAFFMTG